MRKFKTEQEIIENWVGDVSNPIVSVCCIAYNHELFIEDALEGILIQKTDFPFEVIIHEDASTDNTAEIIREYAERYPRIIKVIFQKENQYSQGKGPDGIAMSLAQGEFISYCDGDDYWTDPGKLQLQVSQMRLHEDCNLCFHSADVLSDISVTEAKSGYGFHGENSRVIPCEEIILKGGGYMPMASILFRKKVIDDLREIDSYFLLHNMTHFFYQFFGSYAGGALYLPQQMSVYRSMHEGSWSFKTKNDIAHHVAAVENYIGSVHKADKITNYKCTGEFSKAIEARLNSILRKTTIPIKVRKDFYRKYNPLLGLKNRFLWLSVFQWRVIHKIGLFLVRRKKVNVC